MKPRIALGTGVLLCAVLAANAPAAASPQSAVSAPAAQVVLISIDGLRPDAISPAGTPTLTQLIKQGAYCAVARTVAPSATLPAHVSLLTGLDPKRHGVTWNVYRGRHYKGATLFSLLRNAGHTTAMLIAKQKLAQLAPPAGLDFVYGALPPVADEASALDLAAVFDREWSAHRYGFTFIHLREADDAGHRAGWMSRPYLQAVTEVDRAVGVIFSTIVRTGYRRRTALIVTADHGGDGHDHSAPTPANRTIPWIVVGPGVRAGLLLDRPLHIYDTAPTVLALLGAPIPADLDGAVISEILTGPGHP